MTVIPGPARSRHTGWILAAIVSCQMMVVLDATVVNIALPHIQTALHMEPAQLSWVLNAYLLTFGGFLLLGARAGDLRGRRKVLIAGVSIFTLASLAAGLSNSSGLLLSARALQGVGAALASPSALALLTVSFAEGRDRMRALSYYTAVSIGGSAAGLILGGLIVASTSWRWIFFINLPIGVALVVGARMVLPETPPRPGALDLAGALTSTLGMSAVVFGLIRAASSGWGNPVTVAYFAGGALLLGAFILAERRAPMPITPLHLFANRTRSMAYVVRLILIAAGTSVFFYLSQYFQEVLGYSPVAAGLAFVPLLAAVFASSQVSAHVLIGRLPNKVQLLVGLTMSACALMLLAHISVHTSYLFLAIPLALFGTGNGMSFMVATSMGLTGVKHEDAGAASGLLNAAQQVGGAVGLAILVTVFEAAFRTKAAQLPPDASARATLVEPFVAGTDLVYLVAGGLVLALVVLVALVPPPRPEDMATTATDLEQAEAASAGLI